MVVNLVAYIPELIISWEFRRDLFSSWNYTVFFRIIYCLINTQAYWINTKCLLM